MDKSNELGVGGSIKPNTKENSEKARKERIEALLSRQRSETAEMTNAYDS